ncbi:MAG: polyprenol monophosphomannose synthase [Deferribacteres bacterium]|nr:polyprenol monophosphomannose synthase [candidate division KSB1 bacterium]MCB9509416.1 polyprenol monophosphomannose synthase [Deferribacteres bacterium]
MNKEIARTLIVIPTYNEASNISKLLERIFKLNVPNLDVLFVDDNSPDNTAGLIEDIQKDNPHVFLIKRSGKMGLGTAYVAGFGYALEHKYDFIFEMDADLSHNPEDIPLFLEQIDDYDLVIGSRYLTGMNVANWPLSRLFLSLFANWYTRIITGMPFKDCTSGFKCFRRHVLESIGIDQIHSDGYSFQIELHYLAWKKGFRIKEMPIIFIDRESGSSKMSRKIMKEAALMVWRLKFRDI